MSPRWRQMVAVIECRDCRPGPTWTATDTDGAPIVVSADPCARHRRMLERLGWAR